MRRSDVDEVARLAREVSAMAEAIAKADKKAKLAGTSRFDLLHSDISSMDTAALRRRSLDLTRSLARLRNPWRKS